ncbi:MAG: ferredoxin [Chloroflexi bacterium]|nr:ferredoxin [Chloroflexota bacterium]
MRVHIDRELCIGAGECVLEAPAIFALDDEGKSTIIATQDTREELLWAAAEACPALAVILETAEGDQVYPQ